jgi:uncharacterized protein (DUF433 family)
MLAKLFSASLQAGSRGILVDMSERELLSRITRDPNICHGKPVIRGLRYPVSTLLELLASGMTPEEILQDYPDLEMNDLRAALLYAARLSEVKHMIAR